MGYKNHTRITSQPGILNGSAPVSHAVAFCFNGRPHDHPCQAGRKDVKAQDSEKIVADEA